MTPEQKAEIRARADASTPGPWHWNLPGQCCSGGYCCDDAGLHEVDYFYRVEMAFIAAARTDIPDLLDDIERLEAEVERLRAKVAEASRCYRHHYDHREYVCTCEPMRVDDSGRDGEG